MPVNFSGTWNENLAHSEGWPGLIESMDIDPSKLPADIKVTETIRQSDDNDTLVIVITNNKDAGFRKEFTVNVGSNFIYSIFKKCPFECTTAWQGDKLVLTGVDGRSKVTRELLMGGQMLVTFEIGDKVAKSFFEKQ